MDMVVVVGVGGCAWNGDGCWEFQSTSLAQDEGVTSRVPANLPMSARITLADEKFYGLMFHISPSTL